MQLPIARFEFLFGEEQRVVEEGEGVEDVEVRLRGEDQRVVDEGLQAGLQRCRWCG